MRRGNTPSPRSPLINPTISSRITAPIAE
jgi:hypothetical protein